MKQIAYLFILLAIAATFYFAIISMGDSFSFKGLATMFVVTVPYFAGMAFLAWFKSRGAVVTMAVGMIALSLLGTFMLYYSILLHPDAQSALTFFVLPVYQFPAVLILAAFAFFMERKARGADKI